MNKFKVLAVAVASLAGVAFAGDGGDLWNFANLITTDNCGKFCGQVHTPGAVFCWSETPQTAANGYGKPCFEGTGGWWFGYADEGGDVKDKKTGNKVFVPKDQVGCETDLDPTQAIGTVVIEKYIETDKQNDAWKAHTKETVSGKGEKHYLIKGYGLGEATDGLDVVFTNPSGTDKTPSVSAVGFNWRGKKECERDDYEKAYTEDLTKASTGLCIRYKADDDGVDVELGWNESINDYNTWIVKLPKATDWKTINMKWEHFAPSYVSCDDFKPQDVALKSAEALKFALKNRESGTQTVHFELKEVGWYGSCSGTASDASAPAEKWWESCDGGDTPITSGKMASSYKFNLNGRMLSANFAGTVQVVNLQGKIVAQKALAKGEYLNLANVPMGVYMVRSEKNGIVQKIMVK